MPYPEDAPAYPTIAEHIQASPEGHIPFGEMMDLCLHGQEGYYDGGRVTIGMLAGSTDFGTASDYPVFGGTLGNAVVHAWKRMRQPDAFDLVEIGAGNGTLMLNILDRIEQVEPNLRDALRPVIVEKSPALIERQRRLLCDQNVRWVQADARALPLTNVQGLILNNEVVDTLNMNRLVRWGSKLIELYVGMSLDGTLRDVPGEPSPETLSMPESQLVVDSLHLEPFEYREKAIHLGAKDFVYGLSRALRRGFVITIDYGATDRQLANRKAVFRTYGTLTPPGGRAPLNIIEGPIQLAHRFPGMLDITSDANFTSFQIHGNDAGLKTNRYATQGTFLKRHGIEELFNEALHSMSAVERHGSQRLYGNGEIGKNFKVLVQQKGL